MTWVERDFGSFEHQEIFTFNGGNDLLTIPAGTERILLWSNDFDDASTVADQGYDFAMQCMDTNKKLVLTCIGADGNRLYGDGDSSRPWLFESTEQYEIYGIGNKALITSDTVDDDEDPYCLYVKHWNSDYSTGNDDWPLTEVYLVYINNVYDDQPLSQFGCKQEWFETRQIPSAYLPSADAVADATGDTPTSEEFNALLASLRTAGYLGT